jgi:hypothetical protein
MEGRVGEIGENLERAGQVRLIDLGVNDGANLEGSETGRHDITFLSP